MLRVAVLATLCCLAAASEVEAVPDEELDPNFRKSFAVHATKLRADLLDGYDNGVPPESDREPSELNGASRSGANIGLQIRFFKVKEVNIADGSMMLKIWWRMSWVDQRLSWNPAEYNNVTSTHVSSNEIWVPDLQPYNAQEGIGSTLDDGVIPLSSDGTLYWSRPGMLDILCKYSGLVMFPKDKLSCVFDVGGWMMSGGWQGLELMGGGYAFSNAEPSAGPSYQQFVIDKIDVAISTFYYECCALEPWPVASYTVTMERRAGFYDRFFYFMIILTVISTLPAFMTWEVGERLGYGITLILVIETAKTTMAEILPTCGELLWADMLMDASYFTCLIALLESCVVLFLAYYEEETLLPQWFLNLCDHVSKRFVKRCLPCVKTEDDNVEGDQIELEMDGESPAAVLYRKSLAGSRYAGTAYNPTTGNASPRVGNNDMAPDSANEGTDNDSPRGSPRGSRHHSKVRSVYDAQYAHLNEEEKKAKIEAEVEGAKRLRYMFYERLFFKLDAAAGNRGIVANDHMKQFLAYANFAMDSQDRDEALAKADVTGDGSLVRWEFVLLCTDTLNDVPMDELALALDDFNDAITAGDRRNIARWQAAAKSVDIYTRFTLPFAYITFVIIHYNTDYTDYYSTEPTLPMFELFGPSEVAPENIIYCLIVPILYMVAFLGFLQAKWFARKVGAVEEAPVFTAEERKLKIAEKAQQTIALAPTTGRLRRLSKEVGQMSSEGKGRLRRLSKEVTSWVKSSPRLSTEVSSWEDRPRFQLSGASS